MVIVLWFRFHQIECLFEVELFKILGSIVPEEGSTVQEVVVLCFSHVARARFS